VTIRSARLWTEPETVEARDDVEDENVWDKTGTMFVTQRRIEYRTLSVGSRKGSAIYLTRSVFVSCRPYVLS